MSYAQYLKEDQRLVILRTLNQLPSYTANSSVLHGLLQRYGHNPSRDQVKTELRWLEEQGLVTVDDIDGLLIARITERGQDVVAARVAVPGVKKPGA